MPTYSYACTECDNRFDVVQSFADDALTTCEKCTGRLRKLFNSVGVVFKGSGFYRTDSRESAKRSTNGSVKSDSSSGTDGSSSGDKPSSSSSEKSEKSSSTSSDTSNATASKSAATAAR